VSLVEYATSIEQVKSKLQFVWPNPSQVDRSIEAGTASTGSLESEETRDVCSNEEKSLLKLYHILLTGLHKIEQRVDRSFQAIMSSMSILESERAIVQGAAITRLTELAFFFIPLSFAATFFSMQIQVSHGLH
jgi:Mg2+ and Co2+ transporter CorA